MVLALALLGGFVALIEYESRRGIRFLSGPRSRFDGQVARISFIYAHVDFPAFVRDEARRQAGRFGHAVATHTLEAVRVIERSLTRAVRYLRTRHPVDVRPQGSAREFVRTLADFKGQLNATHLEPEVSEHQ